MRRSFDALAPKLDPATLAEGAAAPSKKKRSKVINCPACGEEISRHTHACPKCGHTITENMRAGPEQDPALPPAKAGCLGTVLVGLLLASGILFSLLSPFVSSNE